MKYLICFVRESDRKSVTYDQKQLAEMYLDYFNDFLTYDRFAEYYGLNIKEATNLIDLGRLAHEDSVNQKSEV